MAYRTAMAQGHAPAAGNLGALLLEEGDLDNANDAIRTAIRLGHTPALTLLGSLYQLSGQDGEAEHWYRKAIDAGEVRALPRLGALLLKQGRIDDAGACYRQAADTGGTDALYELGLFLHHIGDAPNAETSLRAAADQDHVPAKRLLARLLAEQARPEEADALSMEVLDYLIDMGQKMDAASAEFDTSLAEAYVQTGRLEYEHGEDSGAEEYFQRAAEAGSVDGLFWLGVIREDQGDIAGAEELYRQANAAHHAGAAARLGVILQATSPEEAERLFRQAYDAGDADGAFRLGALLAAKGHDILAEPMYRAAAEALHPEACRALVELLSSQGRPEAEHWTRAAAEAANLYGSWFQQRRRGDDAELWYRRAAEAGHLGGAFNLGMLLHDRDDPEGSDYWLGAAAAAGHPLARMMTRGTSVLPSEQ